MEFEITSDSWWECRVIETLQGMHLHEEFHHFLADDYGDGVPRIFVVMNCHAPSHPRETRIFFDQPRNTLYMDVMLNFELMRTGGVLERRKQILAKLGEDVPVVAAKYASANFDGLRFGRDFREWIKNYPNFPIPHSEMQFPGPQLKQLAETDGEIPRIVSEEFGPLVSSLGLAFWKETKEGAMHVFTFRSAVRWLAVIKDVEQGANGIQPGTSGQSKAKGRLFILQYVKIDSDGTSPLELSTIADKLDTVVGRIAISQAGDFRVALRALAEFFQKNSQVLFPERRMPEKQN